MHSVFQALECERHRARPGRVCLSGLCKLFGKDVEEVKKTVEITREIIHDFIMDEPSDFVDFCQKLYEAEVMAYLDYRQQEFDEWIDSRIRGEG